MIPDSFAQLPIAGGFAADFGPIYAKREGDRVWFGFRVEKKHLNPFNMGHGGALATFADMQLAAYMRAGRLVPRQAPTISLSLNYLAPARLGDWVQGEIVLAKRTGRLAFSDSLLCVGDAPIVRSQAMFAYSDQGASLDAPRDPPTLDAAEPPPPPDGFEPLPTGPGFGAFFGPAYWRPGTSRLGFRVAPRHINLFGLCHGGALATFADYQVGPLRRNGGLPDPFAPTLSLDVDFVAPARLGEWIEADVTLVRTTSRYIFTQAVLSNAHGAVARSSAIYAVQKATTG